MTNQWRQGKRVAIVGAGPGGLSAALAMLQQGYDVRLYERRADVTPLGGGVLLSVPVLAILRKYGVDVGEGFGSKTLTQFRNHKGKIRARLPFNPAVEKAMGIPGWHYGILRASAFAKMMAVLPDGILQPNHALERFENDGNEVTLHFEKGEQVTADLLIGADGIRSQVSRQLFGEPDLFHVGLRVWLAWCDQIDGLDRDLGVIHHSKRIQASYFPMLHEGKPGYEWWIVEPVAEDAAVPANPQAHVRGLLADFCDPMPRFPDHTDLENHMFRWEIYNRPSLRKWCEGRVACLGDAVHPVSPYAAYGMGMAIEDGYFLSRAFEGRALDDRKVIDAAFARYQDERVDYVNHQVEFARELGNRFHHAPAPVALLRDAVFNHTSILQKMIQKDAISESEKLSLQLRELHIG